MGRGEANIGCDRTRVKDQCLQLCFLNKQAIKVKFKSRVNLPRERLETA